MKAVVLHAPKDLRLEDREEPEPGPNQARVRVGAGGICGSDLHYYFDGGVGTIRLREPMILGHEAAGVVEAIGQGVEHVQVGDKVSINPSRPCWACDQCRQGTPNRCRDMRFHGSAMRLPHTQGLFREHITVGAEQLFPLPSETPLGLGALAEPFAVALHAANQADSLYGKRVLVAGAGPIGVLVVIAARFGGAAEIAVTDIIDPPLAIARRAGADTVINAANNGGGLARAAGSGFDIVFEASGAPPAFRSGLDALRPGGTIVQIGLGGDAPLPMTLLAAKEITLRGAFRFHEEFGLAVRLIAERRVDLTPVLTDSIPVAEVDRAFALAADRSQAMKVQLTFS